MITEKEKQLNAQIRNVFAGFVKTKRIQALQNAKTETAVIVKENIRIQHDFVRIMLTDE